jgi:hypothetical protein
MSLMASLVSYMVLSVAYLRVNIALVIKVNLVYTLELSRVRF